MVFTASEKRDLLVASWVADGMSYGRVYNEQQRTKTESNKEPAALA